jgi:hypothetical protein
LNRGAKVRNLYQTQLRRHPDQGGGIPDPKLPGMAAYRRCFADRLGEVPDIARLQSVIVPDTLKKGNRIPL